MTLRRDPETGTLLKVCSHCGAANRTLGTRCPSCDRSYDTTEPGLIDELPLIDPDDVPLYAGGWIVVAAVNTVIAAVMTPLLLLRRLLRRALRRAS